MSLLPEPWMLLTLGVGLYANAVLIASNLYLMLRLRKGPPRPKRTYAKPRTARSYPHPMDEVSTALVRQLLRELEIHFQVHFHETWDQIRDPAVPDVHYRPWTDGQENTDFANLATPEVSIQWHITPGRFCFSDRHLTTEEWARWYKTNLSRIKAARDT